MYLDTRKFIVAAFAILLLIHTAAILVINILFDISVIRDRFNKQTGLLLKHGELLAKILLYTTISPFILITFIINRNHSLNLLYIIPIGLFSTYPIIYFPLLKIAENKKTS